MYDKYVKHFLFVGFWVLMAVSCKFMVLWDVAWCSLVANKHNLPINIRVPSKNLVSWCNVLWFSKYFPANTVTMP